MFTAAAAAATAPVRNKAVRARYCTLYCQAADDDVILAETWQGLFVVYSIEIELHWSDKRRILVHVRKSSLGDTDGAVIGSIAGE